MVNKIKQLKKIVMKLAILKHFVASKELANQFKVSKSQVIQQNNNDSSLKKKLRKKLYKLVSLFSK